MGRAARRKQERRRQPAPILIAGDGIVARSLGQVFPIEMAGRHDLPPRRFGHHRWIATAAYILSDLDAAHAYDKDTEKFLDHENLFSLAIGCWDCEQILGPGGVAANSFCTGEAS